MTRRWLFALALVLGIASGVAGAFAQPAATTVVVPIAGQIDEGMAHLVARALTRAHDERARAVVLDVDTLGGLLTAGVEIRDGVLNAQVPVYAYVSHRAISAGALVTLASPHILMAPSATFGDAQPIQKTAKNVAFLRSEFRATAIRNHRDPSVAQSMVDASLPAVPSQVPGQLLTLGADQAVAAHLVDGTAADLPSALRVWGLPPATQTADYTLGERLARFATTIGVSELLLAIGLAGLLIEMQTLHGIAGLAGVGALALFFGSHVYAGFSDAFVVLLAVAGLTGILLELHVFPGHGAAGLLGLAALVGAIFLSFGLGSFAVALQAMAVAIVAGLGCFIVATRVFPESAFMRRLTFAGTQGPEYVTSADYRALLGESGLALSYLRPAGVAMIAGRRIDVLTEGEFVPAGAAVEVTRVEGARVFVRPIERAV